MIPNNCLMCDLCQTRRQVVTGKGSTDAKIMIIGEAPGYSEDKQGIPFVGKAGQLLDKYLELANLTPNDIYITNVVKCKPPANRPPYPVEIETCILYLYEELRDIKPMFILLLGNTALRAFTNYNMTITECRGKPIKYTEFIVLPTFHPSAALRNKELRLVILEDFKKLIDLYREYNPLHITNFNDEQRIKSL